MVTANEAVWRLTEGTPTGNEFPENATYPGCYCCYELQIKTTGITEFCFAQNFSGH